MFSNVYDRHITLNDLYSFVFEDTKRTKSYGFEAIVEKKNIKDFKYSFIPNSIRQIVCSQQIHDCFLN